MTKMPDPTPDKAQRVMDFYLALGRFVAMFARTEFAIHRVLTHYAKIPVPAARALLSGIKTDSARDVIRRLFEIGHLEQAQWDDLAPVLDHLNEINNRRNFLLHHSTVGVAEDAGLVTNAVTAHIERNIKGFDISAAILDNMTADLGKIIMHLNAQHMGKPVDDPRVDAIVRKPWRYMLKSSPLAKASKPVVQARPKRQERPAQSKQSRERRRHEPDV